MKSLSKLLLPLRSLPGVHPVMRGLLLTVLVVLVIFSAAVYGGFIRATRVADSEVRGKERVMLGNQIERLIRSSADAMRVQVTWDEAFARVGRADRPIDDKWADTNLGGFLWSSFEADDVYVVSPGGGMLAAWTRGVRTGSQEYDLLAPVVSARLKAMADNRSVLGTIAGHRHLVDTNWPVGADGRPLTRWSGMLARDDGGLAIVTIASILPDTQFAALRGTPNHLVAVRHLDAMALATLGKSLLLDDLDWSASEPASGNSLELRSPDGEALGWLGWQSDDVGATISAQTMPLLGTYLVFFLLTLGIGGVVIRQALQLARQSARREAQAQRDALHDPMLGLPNRKLMMRRVNEALGRLDAGEAVFLAYIDLDHFKAINDTIGHPLGDEVLAMAVARLKAVLEPEDVLARLASDEFAIVHRNVPGTEQASLLGERIMAAFAEPFLIEGTSLPVTASCGIAWAPDLAQEPDELLRLADIALFRAKQRGRGRFRYFTEDMNASIRWRQDMEVELRRAIAGEGLEMHYQPIVHVADRRVVSFEALVRWHHPDRGDISPGTFVPLAEHCGLMPQLGDWVIRRVFADSAAFGDAEISINLSPLHLAARDFLPQLRASIDEAGIDPARFVFEITEGVLLDNSDRTLTLLGDLRDMGFRIALDDFGTGFSSLSYLRSFQFDRIKIDRSFVQGIENDLDGQAILKTIVNLGRTLRMKVVAEGVETLLQQQLVEASGCELVQGHLHARAMPMDRAAALVRPAGVPRLRLAAG
ncbi:bifunctional diguanylate cyclase/phosphodiesterase [Novosphingobium sp. TH158]|uniref:putative bifunctional diguanylate cyclase/phosphodiesterase n=1 Tax=Novosphingobium sp. TH158 TaxID=2067455 RepID=UPI000C7BDFF0|nr:bifunctional diguanylate cyclase/phosphodiesterase [Novosphingobium sp. TH158]PLK24228.1 bifunctional diguanylate cyclase/phosphodiesterase [Novosphingobium sp. TH158]